jgi:hypothetical protein
MSVSWDLPDLEHDAMPPPPPPVSAASPATASGIAAATVAPSPATAPSRAECSVDLKLGRLGEFGAADDTTTKESAVATAAPSASPMGGVGHCRRSCRAFPRDGAELGGVLRRPQARRARRDRGGGRHDHEGAGGCNRSSVRQPDKARALGARRRRRGAVPVVCGGRLQGRPEQVSRLPPPPQGLRDALQDAHRRRHRPRDALLVYSTIPSSPKQSHPCSQFASLGNVVVIIA